MLAFLFWTAGTTTNAGASDVHDFDTWLDATLGEEFEARFETAWGDAFERAWQATFADVADDAARERFRSAFRETFDRAFREAFEDVWRHEMGNGERAEGRDAGTDGEWTEADSDFDPDKLEWQDRLILTEPADGLAGLSLRAINGSIKVTGRDTDRIRIVAFRTVRARDEARGREYRERFRPVVRREGDWLHVESERPQKGRTPDYIREAKISYEIDLPTSFDVDARSVNGSVHVRDVLGEATIHTVNGAIELTSATGLEGGARGKTVNGSIHVEATRLTGPSNFDTVNGSIRISATDQLKGGLQAKTVNGSIHLRVPPNVKMSLRGKVGMHGKIQTDWGRPEKSRGWLGRSYDVDVNGGGDTVTLTTFNGAISVERTE